MSRDECAAFLFDAGIPVVTEVGSPPGSEIRDAYGLIFRLAGAAPIYDLPSEPIHFAGFRVYMAGCQP